MDMRLRRRARLLKARANLPVKWAAYEAGLTHGPFFPDRLYVESTNYCNLKCVMCPTGLNVIQRPKGYMDMMLFRNIVDEVAETSPAIVLHSWGEPMMHPELFDMVRYARAADLWVETSTNITLLTEDRIRKVLASGMSQLYLAMDGVTKATYERVRVGGNYDKVMRNVERLLELKRQTGSRLRVVLQIIAMNETREEVAESVRRPCPNLWYHGYIFWDGSLVSCERDYDVKTPLGNVRDGVLATWHGDRMRQLREHHVKGDYAAPACANCVEWSWWKPAPFRSAGTAPKVESHEARRGDA